MDLELDVHAAIAGDLLTIKVMLKGELIFEQRMDITETMKVSTFIADQVSKAIYLTWPVIQQKER